MTPARVLWRRASDSLVRRPLTPFIYVPAVKQSCLTDEHRWFLSYQMPLKSFITDLNHVEIVDCNDFLQRLTWSLVNTHICYSMMIYSESQNAVIVGVDHAPKDAYHFIFKCLNHIIAGNSFYSKSAATKSFSYN